MQYHHNRSVPLILPASPGLLIRRNCRNQPIKIAVESAGKRKSTSIDQRVYQRPEKITKRLQSLLMEENSRSGAQLRDGRT